MPEFCEGVESWTQCLTCEKHDTQHPCWPAKVVYWQTEGTLRISEVVVPNRRSNRDKPSAPPREPNGSYDHAIVRDERGVPFLDHTGEPMCQKQVDNLGSDFDRRVKEVRQGHIFTELNDKLVKRKV